MEPGWRFSSSWANRDQLAPPSPRDAVPVVHRREDPRGHQKRVEDPAEPEVDDARFVLPDVVVPDAGSVVRVDFFFIRLKTEDVILVGGLSTQSCV